MLHGSIPWQLSQLSYLHLLDLAENNFTSSIPNGFTSMSSMYQPITSQEETNINIGYGESIYSFDGEVDIVWKGQDYNFQSAADFMTAIDFSSNSLSGGVDKFRRPSFPKYVKELSMWCYPGTHWQSQTFRIP
jgi:hypothetical protein